MPFGAKVGDWIMPLRSPGATARQPRDRQPKAFPSAVLVDGFKRIFGTCRHVPAVPTDIGFERPTIDMDRCLQKGARDAHRCGSPLFCFSVRWPPRFSSRPSILAMASSMASNTSMTEPCRAL